MGDQPVEGRNLEISEKPSFSERVAQWVPMLFGVWLFLTVLGPHQELYKAYFHAILIPVILILVIARKVQFSWRDPFILIALVFFAYAGITTFFVGLGPMEWHVRAARWSVEIAFGLIAFFLWIPHIVRNPETWGRLFLLSAMLGANAAIVNYIFVEDFYGRMTGFGALHNPIRMSAVFLIYFAMGHFLVSRGAVEKRAGTNILLVLTFLSICMAVLFSQSRGPIGAMIVFSFFTVSMIFLQSRRYRWWILLVFAAGVAALVYALNLSFGLSDYIEKLLLRGLSHRTNLWQGYLLYPPDSWLLGFGAGTQPDYLPAVKEFWEPNNYLVSHTHNLYLGILMETGLLGFGFFSALIFLTVRGIVRSPQPRTDKVALFGMLLLIAMLTMTAGQTVVSSIKTIWLIFWLPVIFTYVWCQHLLCDENDK